MRWLFVTKCRSVLGLGAFDPIHALGQSVLNGVIMGGKVIDERHDARSAGTALAAGHRHLSCKAATG